MYYAIIYNNMTYYTVTYYIILYDTLYSDLLAPGEQAQRQAWRRDSCLTYAQSPHQHCGFQRVWLKHNLKFKGWHSQTHRGFTGKFESSNVSRDSVSREFGRIRWHMFNVFNFYDHVDWYSEDSRIRVMSLYSLLRPCYLFWKLPNRVRTNGVVAEALPSPLMNFRGKMWATYEQNVATCAKMRQHVRLKQHTATRGEFVGSLGRFGALTCMYA